MKVNTNIASMSAIRALANTSKALSRALERLATGKRINSAGDDAAGLAIATGIDAQKRGMLQSVRNVNDAQGFLNTAEGAIAEQMNILQRMRELAMQSANGTLGANDRTYLNSELQALLKEFNRIAQTANFNGSNLVDGTFATRNIQVGASKTDTIAFSIASLLGSSVFTKEIGSRVLKYGSHVSASGDLAVAPSTGDLNGDGYEDFVFLERSDPATSKIYINLNNGNGTFSTSTIDTGKVAGSGEPPTLADLDNDGDLDLVIAHSYSGSAVQVRLNSGSGTFSSAVTLQTGAIDPRLTTADVTGDGYLDILISGRDGSIGVRLGNGNGTFSTASTVTASAVTNNYSSKVVSADVNNDGKLDLLQSNWVSDNVVIFLGNGDGTFVQSATVTVSDGPRTSPYVYDFDGDGNLDFVQTADDTPTVVSIVHGNGDGTFSNAQTITLANWRSLTPTFADMDENGTIDMVVNSSNGTAVYIYSGNRDGTFGLTKTLTAGVSGDTDPAKVADIDGDGNLDIAISDTTSSMLGVFYGLGAGAYTSETKFGSFSTMSQSPVLADFNDDGFLDIVQSASGNDRVSVYLQDAISWSAESDVTVLTQEAAQDLLELIDSAYETLNTARSSIGAILNRLDSAGLASSVTLENLSQALSQIKDTDVAVETAELTRLQILQNAGVSLLGQANVQMQTVLTLLGGLR